MNSARKPCGRHVQHEARIKLEQNKLVFVLNPIVCEVGGSFLDQTASEVR